MNRAARNGEKPYRPMMSPGRVEQLRRWHERALEEGRREETITVHHLGRTFVVPADVYPPHALGLAEIVLDECRASDRVLDVGTGSGVNAIVAAAVASHVVAIDVNPAAVSCARHNAELNRVSRRIEFLTGDLFENVAGAFDLILFDPPFRWFRPRSMRERATADENYEALTAFFEQVKDYLRPAGRILLSFGTTGDIDYLWHLIQRAGFAAEELRRIEHERDRFAVSYFVYRLTSG